MPEWQPSLHSPPKLSRGVPWGAISRLPSLIDDALAHLRTTVVIPPSRQRVVAFGVLTTVAALCLAMAMLGRGSPKDPLPPPVLSEMTAPSVVQAVFDGGADSPRILLYVTEECLYCREELLRWRRARVPDDASAMVVIAPTPLPESLRPQMAVMVADSAGNMARELGVRAVPSLFLVDSGGAVIQSRVGLNDPDRIDSLLRSTAFNVPPPS